MLSYISNAIRILLYLIAMPIFLIIEFFITIMMFFESRNLFRKKKKCRLVLILAGMLFIITSNTFAANLEIDNMEYATDGAAQAAYVTNGVTAESVDQQQLLDDASGLVVGDLSDTEFKSGQSFQVSATIPISAVTIKQIDHTGTPTGNWTIRIETDSSGPTGTLADANASIVVTPPGDGTIVKGTFASTFTLNVSTTYWIVVSADAQSTNNYWRLLRTTSSQYANGNCAFYNGSWNNVDADLYFIVYKAGETLLQSYSEATIKTQGSYALKAIATTGALNKTLTKTAAIGNLTGVKNLKFDMRSSRTGANVKIGIVDAGATTELTPTIAVADTYQTFSWDISGVTDANKDAITNIVITISNADSTNTFYLDNFNISQGYQGFFIN